MQPRTTQAGDRLELIVLRGGRCPIGIDLASGALVQTSEPVGAERGRHPSLRCFDIAVGRLAGAERLREIHSGRARRWAEPAGSGGVDIDTWAPELAVMEDSLRHVGRVSARRATRYLRPLLHPRTGPILGFHGPSAPFWSFDGTGPTLSIVRPDSGIGVGVSEQGVHAVFRWRGILHHLPLEAPEVLARLDWLQPGLTAGRELTEALGSTPMMLVVRLTAPIDGACHKVAAGLIPRA